MGGTFTKILDKGSLEMIGPYGLSLSLTKLSKNIAYLSNNVITDYGLYILVGLLLILNVFLGSELQQDFNLVLLIIASFSLFIVRD